MRANQACVTDHKKLTCIFLLLDICLSLIKMRKSSFYSTKIFVLFSVTSSLSIAHCPSQINSTVSMSGLHAVSSSDDVKPPFGLKPMSAHSPGPMLSQKRLCAICGDRSSGMSLINTNPKPSEGNIETDFFCLVPFKCLLLLVCYWFIAISLLRA